MHNVEYKAELRDFGLARVLCRNLGATSLADLAQIDTYFRVPNGRLKKRETEGEPTEYVFYDRPNRSGPKVSSFTIYDEPTALERFGTRPLPVWVVVRKQREILIQGCVRIHLDRVEGVGDFIEFEVLVSGRQTTASATKAIDKLRQALAPVMGEPIAGSYADLMAQEADLPGPDQPSDAPSE